MNIKLLAASALLALASAPSAMADSNIVDEQTTGFYGSVGMVNIDPEVAVIGLIEDTAMHWKLGWENHHNAFVWSVGMSGYLYSDNASFTVRTERTFGGESDSDSSATALNGYIEAGYKHVVNDAFDVALLAGYEHVFASERGVGNCPKCPSEDIELDAGIYIQPRATFQFGNDWYLSLAYNAYMSGDVESGIMLSLGAQY